jgi:hypothetical protein
VGIENLKIIRVDKGNHTDGANIYLRYAVDCWVKGVESEYTCKHHIECFDCAHIKISGCYFHNARNFGGKGRGYGVSLAFSTSYCLIENNIFRRLRHSMSLEAGANTNVFTYNFSTDQTWSGFFWRPDGRGAEICLHGSLPFANLFEQNIVEQIQADGWNTPNGLYNTFVRNMIWDENEKKINTMYLVGAEKTNVLGCIIKSLTTCHPFYPFTGCGETTFCTDIYGWDKGKFRSHNFKFDLAKTEFVLGDISYFYSSRPEFVSSNFSWPSIGPKVTSELLLQNIPAKERFYSNRKKTYLINPTLKPN